MLVDLLHELVAGIEKAQTVVIGLSQKLDAAGIGQGVEGAENFGAVLLELFQQNPGKAVGDLELPIVLPDQLEQQTVGRKITFVGHLSADGRVFVVVEIAFMAVEHRVVSQP